ncbi:hypothetical protein Hanom_Chr08g00700581 [Helianthus anomalus]
MWSPVDSVAIPVYFFLFIQPNTYIPFHVYFDGVNKNLFSMISKTDALGCPEYRANRLTDRIWIENVKEVSILQVSSVCIHLHFFQLIYLFVFSFCPF